MISNIHTVKETIVMPYLILNNNLIILKKQKLITCKLNLYSEKCLSFKGFEEKKTTH